MIRKYVKIIRCVNCGATIEQTKTCQNCGVLFLEEMPYQEWVEYCNKLNEKAKYE